jgi:hypothetical protein
MLSGLLWGMIRRRNLVPIQVGKGKGGVGTRLINYIHTVYICAVNIPGVN